MVTMPLFPSTRILSPLFISLVALPVPTTAGIINSRATTAECESTPPESVTMPTILLKTTTQAGVGFLVENTQVSQRYWHLLSPEDRADCEHGLTRRLVRRAARQLLRGRLSQCGLLLKTSWAVSRTETVRNLLTEVARFGRT